MAHASRGEEPCEDGETGRIQAIKGFVMPHKGNRRPLGVFKHISDSVVYSL